MSGRCETTIVRPRQQVVTIPISLYKSMNGQYFVGQTQLLVVSDTSNAWAALVNPSGSGVDLFVNVITFSNFSTSPMTAEIWFNANLVGNPATSDLVSPSNLAFTPEPTPKALIQYVQSTPNTPTEGINVFDRIIPPQVTVVSEEDGKYIIPPGGNFLVFLTSDIANIEGGDARVALGWWEKRVIS